MAPFKYPMTKHRRRHGPEGYTNYKDFRSWLRDEFVFRCVFCLGRELWWRKHAFEIDHMIPQSQDPTQICDYENLVYVCAQCNRFKRAMILPDPCRIAFGKCLRIDLSGRIHARNKNGERLIKILCLDRPEAVEFRSLILDTVRQIRQMGNRKLLKRWLGYPKNLPDLAAEQPPRNSRPRGVQLSYYALRQRGELPDLY
jgi:hypothetical protein